MATSGIRSAAHAIRRQDTQAVEQRVRELEYAQVTEVNPLRAELHGHNIELDEHDVAFGQWLKRYDRKKGVKVGDTLVVKRMRNQTWIATDAISTESATGHQDFTAGDGLSFSGDDNDVLDVGAGTGLNVGATNVSIDEDWLEDFVDTHAGPSITAGDGLTLTGAVLDVGAGTGITVAANNVAVDTTVISTRTYAEGLVTTHEADTTSVHGIANTANIAYVNAANTFTLAQTLSNAGGKTTLTLTSTGTDTGLTLGSDTNLYRSAASTLKTDDTFIATGGSGSAYHSLHNVGYTAYDMDFWDLQKPTGGRLIFRSGAYPQVELRPANGGLGGNFQFYDAAGALAHQVATVGNDLYLDGAAAGSTLNLRPGGASAIKLQVTGTAMTSTVPLAMGSNKITGLAAATTNGDAVRYEQISGIDTANIAYKNAANTFTLTQTIGANAPVSTALLSAVQGGNDVEFGHSNTAGYRSTLGAEAGNGYPFIAFSAEAGTTSNTYRTRGNVGTVIRGDIAGGLVIGKVATASADNQSLTTLLTLGPTGVLTLGGDTNLYRLGADSLATDDTFSVGGSLNLNGTFLNLANTGVINIGDVALARASADVLAVDAETEIGTWSAGYAGFWHSAFSAGGTSYALLAQSNGATYLNAATSQFISMRINNSEIASVYSTGLSMNAPVVMNSQKVTGLAAATTNGDAVRYEQLTGLSSTYQPLDSDLTTLATFTRQDYTVSSVTTDRTLNANATSIDELADVLGTLITDLTTAGLLT